MFDILIRASKTKQPWLAYVAPGGSFYGKSHEPEYRNVQYVYRGHSLESIMEFSNRMKVSSATA